MEFTIKLQAAPGDQTVYRGQVERFDSKGAGLGPTIILEGEKFQEGISLPKGGSIVIKELERPVVYNPETKGAEYLDLTPGDPLNPPNEPFKEGKFEPTQGPPGETAEKKKEREDREKTEFDQKERERREEFDKKYRKVSAQESEANRIPDYQRAGEKTGEKKPDVGDPPKAPSKK